MSTAIEQDYRERVLSRLWGEPDGLTEAQLLMTFPWHRHAEVASAIRRLVAGGLVHRVVRVHGTESSHLDHARLVVMRRAS